MTTKRPHLIVIAGPNGAGKSDNIKDIEIWNMFMGQSKYEKEIRKNNR